ncbi:MAG TPA: UDP-N-acetylmuramate dehydrogenase [Candidatus Limenecus avicola]|uniref:UDP-N-acetylenolpyruvoylglucosamine reductase n=1 Tax=Candidatus Limenecus avicola TaxID=2840847 RepID=A0A9D1N113_9CLOT|nr:UDP-N-acetylmuramate dehydrogenase [Candidatus Limenecus avicola]
MTCEPIENYELKKHTSFKIGGCAKRAFFPQSVEEFVQLLDTLKNPIVLGSCSNVLISSQGINEDVIITSKMNVFEVVNNTITAQCGVKVPMLAREAEQNNLSGFEFMIGFPGSVGGAVYMNASAHSQAISDTFKVGRVFDTESKKVVELNKDEMKFGYRSSILQEGRYILLDAKFELLPVNKEEISSIMNRNLEFRKGKQPSLAMPNAGSIFRNPPNDSAGRLLEKAGVKGLKEGGAQVWLGHANFIVNIENATSKDVSKLMNKMYNEVKDKYTIKLVPEVKYIGIKSKEEEELWDTMLNKK